MTKDEIIEEATRYISPEEVVDFPEENDLFYLTVTPTDKSPQFVGYGICRGYVKDIETKPHGKWIYFNYMDLSVFPSVTRELKLQPPHIAKGAFETPDRLAMVNIHKSNARLNATDEQQPKYKINRTNKGVCTFFEFPKELWKE